MKRLGTVGYMAPELLFCDREARNLARQENVSLYGKEVDCWAIGILAYESLFGCLPWNLDTYSYDEWMKCIREQGVNFEPSGRTGTQKHRKEEVSAEAKDFILSCLEVNRESRLTVQQMSWHPWITKSVRKAIVEQRRPEMTHRDLHVTELGGQQSNTLTEARREGSTSKDVFNGGTAQQGATRDELRAMASKPFRSATLNTTQMPLCLRGETRLGPSKTMHPPYARDDSVVSSGRLSPTQLEKVQQRQKYTKKELPFKSKSFTQRVFSRARGLFFGGSSKTGSGVSEIDEMK